jgi:choline kinase
MEAREKTNISDFMLDARTPSGVGTPSVASDYEKEEKERERAQEEEIQKLLHETRVWRVANSAFWVAWGIVQAKVPELDEEEKRKKEKRGIASSMVHKVKEMAGRGEKPHPMSDPLDDEEKRIQEESRQDRPEGREQEEAHREGDDTTVADPSGGIVEEPEHEDEEFDYLAYTQERAMFFWGDCVQMGIVKEEDLPEALRKSLKMVPY